MTSDNTGSVRESRDLSDEDSQKARTGQDKGDSEDKGRRRRLIAPTPSLPSRRWTRMLLWARRAKLGAKAEIFLAVLAIMSATSTYFAMSREAGPIDATSGSTIQILLRINAILVIGLLAIVGRWFVRMWLAYRSKAPGSRLHTRVTGVFIGLAAVPPIVMAIFSALFLEFGIQTWFSEKVRTTLNSSLEVAQAYMVEHRTAIEKDLAAIALAYSRLNPLQLQDRQAVQRVAESALSVRLLSELVVVQERGGEGSVLARANANLGLQTSRIELGLMERARRGETVVTFSEADDTVVGIIRLSNFFRPTYLYIARDVNPEVISYLRATRDAVADYENLEGKRSGIQLQFNVVFVIVALLILLAALWLGLRFSTRLVAPISDLVDAAERVGRGDLSARVPSFPRSDEVGTLSRAFNRMTDQLETQQKELITANADIEDRRRFLEEVLEGVSAGVMGLKADQSVFLSNRAACQQLGCEASVLAGRDLGILFQGFEDLLAAAREDANGTAQGQVTVEIDDEERTLLARISATHTERGKLDGFVVTFDDLTDQLAHQRTAAWADVARRVAHEIKNPLTPIQLSAERLQRKYLKEIASDPKVFSQCTETIIRQVGDLRRMVDEFSSFARMPAPIFRRADLVDVLRHAVFLQEVGWPEIGFRVELGMAELKLSCDERLLGQALTNVLKNAAESVTARLEKDAGEPGQVFVSLSEHGKHVKIVVEDNGLGLPEDQKHRLMEPYVTTRQKGTGLGLAIVRRIFEEHGGSAKISDRTDGAGARVELILNLEALERRAAESRTAAE